MREVGDEITGIDPVIFLDDQEERKRRGATSSRNDSIASGSPPEIPPRKESLGNIVQVVKNDEMQKLLRRAFLKLKSKDNSSKFSSEISPINPSVGDSSDSDSESYKEADKEADNSVKFSYQYCHDKTFQGKNYKIFRNNKDDKTKISYLPNASPALNTESSNQESDIANKVKKSIEESIKKMFGDKTDQEDADDKKTVDKEIDSKTKLKFYKYLALAVKLGGVGNKGIEYHHQLNELNESIAKEEDKLSFEEAKKLSFLFQRQSKEQNIYTGRIAEDRENTNLVGMRSKRIPLDLLKEMADGLGKENSEEFKDFLCQINLTEPATQFSTRLATPARVDDQASIIGHG